MKLNLNIKTLIKESMLAKNAKRTQTLRNVLKAFQDYCTAEDSDCRSVEELPEAKVTAIVQKMIDQDKKAIGQFLDADRSDLAAEYKEEVAILEEFVPRVTEQDVNNTINEILATGVEPIKKNMGVIIKSVKAKLPTADGKMVSQIVGSRLN